MSDTQTTQPAPPPGRHPSATDPRQPASTRKQPTRLKLNKEQERAVKHPPRPPARARRRRDRQDGATRQQGRIPHQRRRRAPRGHPRDHPDQQGGASDEAPHQETLRRRSRSTTGRHLPCDVLASAALARRTCGPQSALHHLRRRQPEARLQAAGDTGRRRLHPRTRSDRGNLGVQEPGDHRRPVREVRDRSAQPRRGASLV